MAPLPLLRQVVICWRILCSQIWHKLCAQGRIRRASVGNLRGPFTLVTCGTCGTCATWVLLMRPALTRFWPPCHKPDFIGSGSNMLFSVKQRGGPEHCILVGILNTATACPSTVSFTVWPATKSTSVSIIGFAVPADANARCAFQIKKRLNQQSTRDTLPKLPASERGRHVAINSSDLRCGTNQELQHNTRRKQAL